MSIRTPKCAAGLLQLQRLGEPKAARSRSCSRRTEDYSRRLQGAIATVDSEFAPNVAARNECTVNKS